MGADASGKAYALTREVPWSPADGDFVKHCPTAAIAVTPAAPGAAQVIPEETPDVA
jgi:hypothetical protein